MAKKLSPQEATAMILRRRMQQVPLTSKEVRQIREADKGTDRDGGGLRTDERSSIRAH